jgi:hypothetical protein
MLFTSQRTTSGQETGYGFCWGVKPDPQGRRMYSHGGGSVGGTSFLLIYPDDKIVLAIQNNLTDANYQELPEQIARLFVRPAGRSGADAPASGAAAVAAFTTRDLSR